MSRPATASIPRLPVLDWHTFSGSKHSSTPCLLDLPQAQLTHSGRASILLALEMLGLGRGDRVLVPTYHCPTMIAPVIQRQAQALFYPLRADGSPDLDWIARQDLGGVRAILAAHFFGIPQHLAPLRAWCDERGIRLIEDCAHALFGVSDGQAVGSWGDLAIASLTKFLPVPEGGCLINNRLLGQAFPSLASPGAKSQLKAAFDIVHVGVNHGRLKGLNRPFSGLLSLLQRFKRRGEALAPAQAAADDYAESFDIDLGQSHRALTAASRCMAQYAPRERIVEGRRQQYRFFAQAFAGSQAFRPLMPQLPEHCAPYVFPLWVDDPDPGYFELRRLGLPVSRWDRLWPEVGEIAGDHGQQWSHHILQLACHQDLSQQELQRMLALVQDIYSPTTKTTSKGEA
ncbi:dTDP-4-amino-4,6-dideoxygalactose transaminase [Paucibacter oligotrophus]|uniref:dTDP-4-amino-4,6-dideoxygalactose transaminase n=1 Tax=Roseateles oligotrophus TaxID=1769250 RepID=A0A840L7I9_9BURK|nr:DegT/DnrJ/EryC1/StrS family aminotransferase [Roseateles oligotrophus]MBB4844150.1 dTDP-4-amino-4,6-dideoxygalactose transaminase [Roseateles oligotrophus]